MLIPEQIRAARAVLGWSAAELAKESGLSLRTIQTLENSDNSKNLRKSSLLALRFALEAAGIEFTGTPEDLPGVRMNLAKKNAATS